MNDMTQSPLDRDARAIMQANDRGRYSIPTSGLYPYQWNWDSAVAAAGYAEFDLDRAWLELETLFSGQWANGMVPHILFHKVDSGYFPGPDVWGCEGGPIASSGISQPPIAPTFARMVWEKDRAAGDAPMRRLFPKMLAWHQWFMDWRLDRGAVCVTHPWEAGRDNAPDWDGAMAAIDPTGVGDYQRRDTSHVDSDARPTKYDYDRYIWLVQLGRRLKWDEAALLKENPFRVADPTMTFALLRSARDLLAIGQALDLDTGTLQDDIKTLEAGADTLWNPELGAYDSRDVRSGLWAGSLSNASFMCWYAGIDNPAMQAPLEKMMRDSAYPVPSYPVDGEKFDNKRYWRGPSWAVMNMLIGVGLEDCGKPEGSLLRQKTGDLIRNFGFAEYYNPLDGTPAGGESFTWPAAVWLSWAGRA